MIRADFAAFVITFNRPGILYNTIAELCRQTVTPAKILIVNNGEKLDLAALRGVEGVDFEEHMMGFNSGPAGAAYFALTSLAAKNFKWIQWIDDDDPPRVYNLNERMFNHLTAAGNLNIGIIAPFGSYFDSRKGVAVRVENEDIENSQSIRVQTVGGNQCMLINSAVVTAGCLPTASLFFGFEETNLCLKVLQAGFEIIVPSDLFSEYRKLSGRWNLKTSDIRKTTVTPAWRNYYSVRNLIYMFLYEFKKPATALRIITRATLKAIYGLKQPSIGFKELYYTTAAIKDGVRKRLGVRVKPIPKHQK